MASGRLQINEYGNVFITESEENCIKRCSDDLTSEKNVTAFWSVEKIRHRDENRGHRFELKITIRPIRKNRFDGKRETNNNFSGDNKSRSFIIKDQDYPKYFSNLENVTKKSGLRIEKRIFNTMYDNAEIPFHLNYRRRPSFPIPYEQTNNLNIGEYYMGAHPASPYHPRPLRYNELATHNRFNSPNVNDHSLPGHLHHHFYLNKDEVPIFKASLYENSNIYAPPGASGPILYSNQQFPQEQQQPQQELPPLHRPNNLQIENQIRANAYYRDITPTPHTSVHFPGPYQFNPLPGEPQIKGPYDDNRETILEGELEPQKYNTPFELNNNFLNFPPRNNKPYLPNTIPTTSQAYQIDSTSLSPPVSFYGNQYQAQNPHTNNQLYWLGHTNAPYPINSNANFEGSFPYQENTYSEIDPIYHGQPILVTPVNLGILHGPNNDEATKAVSQLPLQNSNIESSSFDPTIENHQTLQENSEPNYTTPYNILTTTQSDGAKNENENVSYPDSINAQLPPPESYDDLTVPYVDATVLTDKPYTHTVKLDSQSDEQNISNRKTEYVTTENQSGSNVPNKMEKYSDNRSPVQIRYRGRKSSAATEKPAIKWSPKRTRQRKPSVSESNGESSEKQEIRKRKISRSTTTTTKSTTTADILNDKTPNTDQQSESDIITVTPIYFHDEPRTSQSVQKSVSVRVGEAMTVKPATEPSLIETEDTQPNTISPLTQLTNRANITRMAMIKKVEGNNNNEKIVNRLATSIAKRARYLR